MSRKKLKRSRPRIGKARFYYRKNGRLLLWKKGILPRDKRGRFAPRLRKSGRRAFPRKTTKHVDTTKQKGIISRLPSGLVSGRKKVVKYHHQGVLVSTHRLSSVSDKTLDREFQKLRKGDLAYITIEGRSKWDYAGSGRGRQLREGSKVRTVRYSTNINIPTDADSRALLLSDMKLIIAKYHLQSIANIYLRRIYHAESEVGRMRHRKPSRRSGH